MAGLGGRGACKGASLDKELFALTEGAEAGARPGLGDFWALWRSRSCFSSLPSTTHRLCGDGSVSLN